jgi:hypothetical protein
VQAAGGPANTIQDIQPGLEGLPPATSTNSGANKYTIVPSGTVAGSEARLAEVKKELALNPEDPYLVGEQAQLDYDIGMLRIADRVDLLEASLPKRLQVGSSGSSGAFGVLRGLRGSSGPSVVRGLNWTAR